MIQKMRTKVRGVAFYDVPWLGPISSSSVRALLREFWETKRSSSSSSSLAIDKKKKTNETVNDEDERITRLRRAIGECLTSEVFDYVVGHELYGKL